MVEIDCKVVACSLALLARCIHLQNRPGKIRGAHSQGNPPQQSCNPTHPLSFWLMCFFLFEGDLFPRLRKKNWSTRVKIMCHQTKSVLFSLGPRPGSIHVIWFESRPSHPTRCSFTLCPIFTIIFMHQPPPCINL